MDLPKQGPSSGISLLSLGARLVLGAIFIYASIDKILHPEAFAKAVFNYQILPHVFINATAIVLPWMELILGIFLIVGFLREGSVGLVTLLLLVFLGAMAFNLARGLNIDCGCFSNSGSETAGIHMGWYFLRDALFLLPAFYLFFTTFLRGNPRRWRLPCLFSK
ncbi:MAG: DoxX family membrane protein [Desulfobacteraceae bacterium]|nr:MAG: DoxX family membrane protein [Desulfobacteraceae bacterium]